MPLESATYISDLNASNPAASDVVSQGDDHIRLIKSALKATFPNINNAVGPADEDLNQVGSSGFAANSDGSAGTPTFRWASDGDLGLYRKSANIMGIGGAIRGRGAKIAGEVCMFHLDPGSGVMARGGTATGTELAIELDGSTYSGATFPELGTYFGVGSGNFTVPNMKDTGRFPRSRTNSVTVGTSQSNQNLSHSHTVNSHQHGISFNTGTESQNHTHDTLVSLSGTTGGMSANNPHHHSYSISGNNNAAVSATGANTFVNSGLSSTNTGDTDIAHTHSFSASGTFTSGTDSVTHTHSVVGSTDFQSPGTNSNGGSEARPEAYVMCFAIAT